VCLCACVCVCARAHACHNLIGMDSYACIKYVVRLVDCWPHCLPAFFIIKGQFVQRGKGRGRGQKDPASGICTSC